MSPRRVIILGAARSGTKIFRDSFAKATGVGAVPYDATFVWRYGNESEPGDVLRPESLTPKASRFIARYVDNYQQDGVVLEKTVGNTLRVPFVHEVFPDALFVHLVRDGVDSIHSTRSQWLVPADRSYLYKKLRHFPLRLLLGYGRKFALRQLRRRGAGDGRAVSWGVRYPGIDEDLGSVDLLTVCARQWRESVERTLDGLESSGVEAITVRYEDFVTHPQQTLEDVSRVMGLTSTEQSIADAVAMISSATIGKGRRTLSAEELELVGNEVDDALVKLGYQPAATSEEK